MERLNHRDLRAILDFLQEIYTLGTVDVFRARLLGVLPRIVPSALTACVEVDLRRRAITWVADHPEALFPESARIFAQHMHESPLFSAYQRGEGSAVKISDFLSRSRFHRLGLYNEFYRRLGLDYQIAKGLPGPRGLVTAIALTRDRRDFSERDRLVLNLLRPHLNQAYRNAEVITHMREELAGVLQALEGSDRAAITLTRDWRVRFATARAQRWVTEYFGRLAGLTNRLPERLERWVKHQDMLRAGGGGVAQVCEPLVVGGDGRRLVVQLIPDRDQLLLLMEEQRTTPLNGESLEHLGLSRREAEVLVWVAEGKTNREIASILGTSPRTVDKHIEHIYRKLGVETRTAAAALALRATGHAVDGR